MTKILLVEDDKSLREIYGVRLLAEGYDIVSAGDGEEALAMAIKEKPTLIISDVMMPKISGFDMLDILRSTTETRDIKVIMMTALSSDDQRSRGEQLGADRYLVKSQVGIEDVVRTVHEVLGDSSGTPSSTTPAPTPAEPVADSTPADDAAAPTDPTPSVDTAAESASTASTPGNEGAGPLPPQPTVVNEESSLPQPTAPFSSPRPATLGENIIQPTTEAAEPVVTSEAIERELQASPEPITSQVDEAPLTPSSSSDPSAASVTNTFSSSTLPPVAPAVDLEAPLTPGSTPPAVTPTDLSAAPTDAASTVKKDEPLTPPVTPPTTPPVL